MDMNSLIRQAAGHAPPEPERVPRYPEKGTDVPADLGIGSQPITRDSHLEGMHPIPPPTMNDILRRGLGAEPAQPTEQPVDIGTLFHQAPAPDPLAPPDFGGGVRGSSPGAQRSASDFFRGAMREAQQSPNGGLGGLPIGSAGTARRLSQVKP